MRRRFKIFVVPIVLIAIVVSGYAVMMLWNWVMPGLFADVRTLDFGHAVGLLVLCRILFGGFRGRGGWNRHRHWERWASMSPEEREQLMRSRT